VAGPCPPCPRFPDRSRLVPELAAPSSPARPPAPPRSSRFPRLPPVPAAAPRPRKPGPGALAARSRGGLRRKPPRRPHPLLLPDAGGVVGGRIRAAATLAADRSALCPVAPVASKAAVAIRVAAGKGSWQRYPSDPPALTSLAGGARKITPRPPVPLRSRTATAPQAEPPQPPWLRTPAPPPSSRHRPPRPLPQTDHPPKTPKPPKPASTPLDQADLHTQQ